jgi:hypothetical protein
MSAECLDPATTCSVSSNALLAGMGITSCNAPSDAGSDAEGGLDSGTTEAEASSIEDASEERSDGTSPGDGAPPEAAGDP